MKSHDIPSIRAKIKKIIFNRHATPPRTPGRKAFEDEMENDPDRNCF